jgi:hypothetical protein
LQVADQLHLQWEVSLQSSESGLLTSRLEARNLSGVWVIDPLNIDLNGQELRGEGCLRVAGQSRLQLELFAVQLDVDALSKLLPAVPIGADAADTSAENSLPLQLAVALHTEEAMLGGAIARDVRLLLGQEPDCESSLNTSEN